MFCKHCGKEIADDSKYCQHCGGVQTAEICSPNDASDQKSRDIIVETKGNEPSAINYFAKNKIYIILYIVWVIINVLLLLQGEPNVYEQSRKNFHDGGFYINSNTFKANEVLYPFTSVGYQSSYSFNAKYYDWTEFLVYCLLIPLIVYILIMIWKSSIGEKVKTRIKQFIDTEQNISTENSFKLNPTNDTIEEGERRKEVVFSEIDGTPTQTNYDYGVYGDNYKEDTSSWVFEFVVSAFKIVGVIFISFLALTLSLMYIHNFYLGCLLSIGSGILTFCLIRKNSQQNDETSSESKDERSPLYYTGLIVFTILLLFVCYKIGESLILQSINKQTQPIPTEKHISLDEQIKSAVKNTKSKLPLLIDEYLSWIDIKIVKNGIECVYLMDDVNLDLYQIDLVEYKEEIASNLKQVTDKKFLELCMEGGKSIYFRLVSQWDESKSVNITFGSSEIGELIGEKENVRIRREYDESRIQERIREIKAKGGPFDSQLEQMREKVNQLPSEKEYH